MKAWKYPNFAGLVDLSQRDGVDIRPTLLRVITDSYLQNPTHSPDEQHQYTELALRLLDETDIATRATISLRLAREVTAPRAIVLQLARDVLEVSEPILKHSPVLTEADCEAIVAERGQVYADLIAKRGQPEEKTPDDAPAPGATGSRASYGAADTSNTREASDAEELCELFFAAGAPERRLILLNLDYAAIEAPPPPAALQRADIWRLETAALRHETDVVVRELHRALGISQAIARRIVGDELGEPIVVAGKAMMLPADVLQRMILFLNPLVGQSVDRVYQLAALFSEIGVEAARRMVTIWQHADPARRGPGRHQSLPWSHAAENARRALSEISRVPTQQQQMPRRDIIHTR